MQSTSLLEPRDELHYGTAFRTTCTLDRGGQRDPAELHSWCSGAEFAAGGKVFATTFAGLVSDQFNLNVAFWAITHLLQSSNMR